jgi:hypothetical protein
MVSKYINNKCVMPNTQPHYFFKSHIYKKDREMSKKKQSTMKCFFFKAQNKRNTTSTTHTHITIFYIYLGEGYFEEINRLWRYLFFFTDGKAACHHFLAHGMCFNLRYTVEVQAGLACEFEQLVLFVCLFVCLNV